MTNNNLPNARMTGIDIRKALRAHKVNSNKVNEKALLENIIALPKKVTWLQIALIAKKRFMKD